MELKVKGCGISRITNINVKLTITVSEFKTIVAELPGASCSAEDMQVQRGDKTFGNELNNVPLYKVGIVKPNTVLKLVGPGSESKPARPAMESAAMPPPVRAPAPPVLAPSAKSAPPPVRAPAPPVLAPAKSAPPAPADSNKLLMMIIQGQSVMGSWNADILPVLNTTTAKPEEIDVIPWATIVTLAFLDQKMGDKAGEWALVAKKGVKWLKSKGMDPNAINISF